MSFKLKQINSTKMMGNIINKINILFSALLIISFFSCNDMCIDPHDNDKITATGTYLLENVDKNKWGDFQLVLELDKSRYLLNESIQTKLYFENIGKKTIILDGFFPESSLDGPPYLSICTNNGHKIEIFEILENLQNENKIIIVPGSSKLLMKNDLTQVGGFILNEDTGGIGYIGEELDRVYSKFEKGIYSIYAGFYPSPQIYGCSTDTLTFMIE